MVNDDPSTAHDIWKAKMSVTKSCCCMESGDEVATKAEAFLTGLLAGRPLPRGLGRPCVLENLQ
jgi:hypothetical protein